jgi:hypothetical protein
MACYKQTASIGPPRKQLASMPVEYHEIKNILPTPIKMEIYRKKISGGLPQDVSSNICNFVWKKPPQDKSDLQEEQEIHQRRYSYIVQDYHGMP